MGRYKVLKGVAQSFAHQFTSTVNYGWGDYAMSHILRAARETGHETLQLDLLSGDASPPELLTPPVRGLLFASVEHFPSFIDSHKTDLRYVSNATLTVAFDLSRRRFSEAVPGWELSPFVCQVDIRDDRGKVWSGRIEGWDGLEPLVQPRAHSPKVTRSLERYGLTPRARKLFWIRKALAAEVAAESPDPTRDREFLLLSCIQLFSHGHPQDVLRIFAAKAANFTTWQLIDDQLLCGPGVDEALDHLASLDSDEARRATECIERCRREGRLEGFAPATWLHRYRLRFPVGP